MSTAIPSTVGTPQPSGMSVTSPAQAYAQAQAQNIFRQKQLLAQKHQQHMFQQPQHLIQQHQLLQQQKQLQMQQQMQQQRQQTTRLNPSQPSTPIQTVQQQGSPAPSKVVNTPRNQSSGQAVIRLLQFAEQLSPGQEKAIDRLYWDGFIQDFFTNQSTMKMGLFNMETSEQKIYEVNQALQARFFHTQYMCGVTSIQMTLEKTMEYILPGGIMNVECPRASLITKYENGSMVISTCHLWVQFIRTIDGIWKIGHLDFNFQGHEEYITRAISRSKKKIPPTTQPIPESLVNKWGVPPRLFHILQISDIAPKMSEIVFHSLVSGSTPRESLNATAFSKNTALLNNSPIVKTQTRPAPPLPLPPPPPSLQQQATIRQQQAAAGFQLPQGPQTPITYQQQQAYPINTINPQQQLFSPQSPITPGKGLA
ncbi:hypothetical protein HPULCUR_005644 [Helicostylum pulchrum]|uniref:SnoaL-like domain-containing protein n=1 Tax=Helicostylum pulchrum TaxID=562976 RepID=A0ABP9XZN1_9FUNG